MKRNCNGCKALIKDVQGIGCTCQLGHVIQSTKEVYGLSVEYKPLEECEKPMTFTALCKIPGQYRK